MLLHPARGTSPACGQDRHFLLMQMLGTRLPFDEAALLEDNREYLLRSLGLQQLSVAAADGGDANGALPGEPRVQLS